LHGQVLLEALDLGQLHLVVGDRFSQLVDQRAELADLARQRLDRRLALGERPLQPRFNHRKPSSHLGELPRQIRAAAGELAELGPDHRADVHPGRYGVVERQRREGGDRYDDGVRAGEAVGEINHRPGGSRDHRHADSDEEGTEPHGNT